MRDDIVITNADNRSAVVILDVKDYCEECERQLDNTGNYKRLQKDPTATNNGLVQSVIKRFENEKLIHKRNRRSIQNKLSTNPLILYIN